MVLVQALILHLLQERLGRSVGRHCGRKIFLADVRCPRARPVAKELNEMLTHPPAEHSDQRTVREVPASAASLEERHSVAHKLSTAIDPTVGPAPWKEARATYIAR